MGEYLLYFLAKQHSNVRKYGKSQLIEGKIKQFSYIFYIL